MICMYTLAYELIACYENILKHNPTNEECLLGLFFCYAREHTYIQQQQQAMKLYNTLKQQKYLLWSAISLLLQFEYDKTLKSDNKMLQLSEMLLKRTFPYELPMNTEDLLVYVRILMKQEKYNDALTLITSTAGNEFATKDKVEYQRWIADIYTTLGQWKNVKQVFEKLLVFLCYTVG